MRPQPFLKLILKPSIVIFSPSRSHSSANLLIIVNFVLSVTEILSSGVEDDEEILQKVLI